MFGSKDLLFSSEQYGVAKSLRFRSGSSTYLNRTPSAGNQTTWTWSAWVKRGSLGSNQFLLSANRAAASEGTGITFTSSDTLQHYAWNGSAFVYNYITTQVFRDPSAWYHLVVVLDTSNGTSTDRVQLYINGVRVATSAFGTATVPSPSASGYVNAAQIHAIGRSQYNTISYFDGYLAEVNFIDGQPLTPSSFGFYDNNGIWQPQGYTGTYGTNGFYLKFTDVGATSGANSGYGKDFSGFNTNYWTTNNFGTTSTATTYDSMYDSPVNASNGITGIGNYAVLNPLSNTGGLTISNANLTVTAGVAAWRSVMTTIAIPSSGKWYWENIWSNGTNNADQFVGIGDISQNNANNFLGSAANSYGWLGNGTKYNNGTSVAYGSAWAAGDNIGVAVDMDAGTLTFYKNGTSQGTAYSGLSTSIAYAAGVTLYASTAGMQINFGQRPFTYTPPSGFSALNTQNLSTPTITNGAQYMAAVLYTGTGSSQTITASSTNSGNNPNGTTFQPDWVWVKGRSGATDHALYDAVRGVQLQLESNTTTAETTETTGLTAFTSSGFTTGALAQMNTNTATYVAWEWNAGGSNATNTSGSITSTVRANTSAGFSIVTYISNGVNGATIGHGLGVAPSLVIVKCRYTGTTQNWAVYHSSIGATQYLLLNSTAAAATSATYWNNTAPDSSKFTIGTNNDVNINSSVYTYVAYCFAPVSGYSAFGSYTGNGSADGPFVYTGFRPRYVMVKRSDSTGGWVIMDSSRDTYNVVGEELTANASTAAASPYSQKDFLSNGFKLRNTQTDNNASGGTYIYAAFAENPFKIARAR